jgi:hypothetical protein
MLLFFMAAVNYCVFAQTYDKSNGCLSDTLSNSEKVFSRMEVIPLFKGNMKRFLIDNISVDIFLRYLHPKDTLFADTARIKFVMSKKGEISNILVSKAKTALFQAEILRLLRLSSCNWQIGSQGGRYVNGWAQFDVYFRLVRMNGELRINVDYKQHDPPETPME